jgi:hypothetical protein
MPPAAREAPLTCLTQALQAVDKAAAERMMTYMASGDALRALAASDLLGFEVCPQRSWGGGLHEALTHSGAAQGRQGSFS